MNTSNPFARPTSGLVKALSWFDVFIVTVAAPVGSGVLYYAVNMYTKYPGGNVGIAFLLGMVAFLPICYLVASVAGSIPRAGALYVAISRVIGPQIAFIGALLFILGQGMAAGVLGHVTVEMTGTLLTATGTAQSLPGLVSLGKALSSTGGKLLGGIAWVAFFWWVTLGGMRWYRRVMAGFFYVPFIATLVAIFLFAVTSTNAAKQAFDATWGTGVFAKITEAATQAGWTPTAFSWPATVSLLLVVLFAYNGFEMASYAAGEVREARRSAVRGFFLGWLVVGVLYLILAFIVVRPFGDFLQRYDYLFRTKPDALASIMPGGAPSVPFYVLSIASNPWFGLAIALPMVLWLANCIPPVFLSSSRLVFALAMDRALPEKLAEVRSDTGAPTWSTHLTALLAIIGVFLQTLDLAVVLGTLAFCTFFIYWLYGYAAMLMPYRRPELYEQSPLRHQFLGIPLLVFAGFWTFAFGWFVVFFTLRSVSLGVALVLAIFIAAGSLVYVFQVRKSARSKIDLEAVYRNLPPD